MIRGTVRLAVIDCHTPPLVPATSNVLDRDYVSRATAAHEVYLQYCSRILAFRLMEITLKRDPCSDPTHHGKLPDRVSQQ